MTKPQQQGESLLRALACAIGIAAVCGALWGVIVVIVLCLIKVVL